MDTDQVVVEPPSSPHTLIDFSKTPSDTPTTKNSGDTSTQPAAPEDPTSASKHSELLNLSTEAPTSLIEWSNGNEAPPQTSSSPQKF